MEKYVVIAIPLLDYPVDGYRPGDMKVKLQEEVNELIDEVESKEYDQRRTLSEMFDVIQVMVGLIRQQARETMCGQEADRVLEGVIRKSNQDHLYKLHEYARQRGWAAVQNAIL